MREWHGTPTRDHTFESPAPEAVFVFDNQMTSGASLGISPLGKVGYNKLMPKTTPTPSRSRKNVKASFVRRHWVLLMGIFVLVLVGIGVPLWWNDMTQRYRLENERKLAEEKRQYREIKEDMLTLQGRLEALGGGEWEYHEGCSRVQEGFGEGRAVCELGISSVYESADQNEINMFIKNINEVLSRASSNLFKSESEGFKHPAPQLQELNTSEDVDSTGGKIYSLREDSPFICVQGYNLRLQDSSLHSGLLNLEIYCTGEPQRTYFDRNDVDSTDDRFKAESPLIIGL